MRKRIGIAALVLGVFCGLGYGVKRLGNVSASSVDPSQRATEATSDGPSTWLLWCAGAFSVLGIGLVLSQRRKSDEHA